MNHRHDVMRKVQTLLTIAISVGLFLFIFAPAIFTISPAFFKWCVSHPMLSHFSVLLLLLLSLAWLEIYSRQN